jgi:hypothetical protein
MSNAGIARFLFGLVQGFAIYALVNASRLKVWPATDGALYAALLAATICVPFVVVSALSYVRPRLLIGWTVVITALCAGTAWYAIFRDPVSGAAIKHIPPFPFWMALTGALFIAHCLFVAGAIDREKIARYVTYFDVSWKFGVQAALAAALAGAFWLLLWLGAELFRLIKIEFLHKLVQEQWFWIPATTIALTCALHVTDVRVGIVRGVRSLSCTLLSWLLPLMTLLVAAFLVALLFTGLEPLWSTRRAASILLAAAASLVFLINSAYQDGVRAAGEATEAQPMPLVLRVAMLVASAALVPLTVLAAHAVSLRVQQYGWTPERVIAAATVVIAACYALGYAFAAASWRQRFAGLERVNVSTAFVGLAVLAALLTPVADPARISVADQVARLVGGKIAPDNFDYQFLRFNAGRYGVDALRSLAAQDKLPLVAERSSAELQKTQRSAARTPPPPFTAAARAANLTVVYPNGKTLPRDFIETNWNDRYPSYPIPSCLKERGSCDAFLMDLDGDDTDEIVLLRPGASRAWVMGLNPDKIWIYLGEIVDIECDGVRAALLAGNFSLVPSSSRDIEIAGRRLRMNVPADCRATRIKRR